VTSEEVRAEIEKLPFVPFRLHMVSGKTVDVVSDGSAWMLQNSVMILQDPHSHQRYDVLSLRNIERIEQLPV
jgi:hypothetical protein